VPLSAAYADSLIIVQSAAQTSDGKKNRLAKADLTLQLNNQILLLFDHSLRLAPSTLCRGCRDFTDPLYLHHSE